MGDNESKRVQKDYGEGRGGSQLNECAYCKISKYHHGGKCSGKNSSQPCLIFDKDPRGKRVYFDSRFLSLLGDTIPKINEDILTKIKGVVKTIRFNRIDNAEWYKGKAGELLGVAIIGEASYWSDENGVIVDKPKLVLCR